MHIIMCLKFINLCFSYIQITIISVVMQLKQNFVFPLTKLILNFFFLLHQLYHEHLRLILHLILKGYFLIIIWDDEVLSIPKVTTFLAKPLPWLHIPFPSNAVPWPLQVNLLLSLFLVNLTVPNKLFLVQNYWLDYTASYLIHKLCMNLIWSYYIIKKYFFA